MKYLLSLSAVLLSLNTYAACQFELNKKDTALNWTAFKTPKKVGVKAKFDSFEIKSSDNSSIENAIKSANFTVDSRTVNSGNPARDQKIVTFFFTKSDKPIQIQGKVVALKKDVATVKLTFNGVEKDIEMKVAQKENAATLSGKIDVLDFSLDPQLKAINEACKALHEGKTWSDVEIELDAKFTKTCK